MRSKRVFLNWGVATAAGLVLLVGLLASMSRAARPTAPLLLPGNPTVHPSANTHVAPPTTTVSVTYDEAISSSTVSSRTFAVFGSQTGLLSGAYAVDGGTIRLTPGQPFHPGELVQASATTGTLSSVDGTGPV